MYAIPFKLKLYGKGIEYYSSAKYLAVHLEDKLYFNRHIKAKTAKAKQTLLNHYFGHGEGEIYGLAWYFYWLAISGTWLIGYGLAITTALGS
jgi:hypothetical protein